MKKLLFICFTVGAVGWLLVAWFGFWEQIAQFMKFRPNFAIFTSGRSIVFEDALNIFIQECVLGCGFATSDDLLQQRHLGNLVLGLMIELGVLNATVVIGMCLAPICFRSFKPIPNAPDFSIASLSIVAGMMVYQMVEWNFMRVSYLHLLISLCVLINVRFSVTRATLKA